MNGGQGRWTLVAFLVGAVISSGNPIAVKFSNAEIAQKLFLSISTVETHRKNLIAKLGVQNTVGLVKFAIRNNLID